MQKTEQRQQNEQLKLSIYVVLDAISVYKCVQLCISILYSVHSTYTHIIHTVTFPHVGHGIQQTAGFSCSLSRCSWQLAAVVLSWYLTRRSRLRTSGKNFSRSYGVCHGTVNNEVTWSWSWPCPLAIDIIYIYPHSNSIGPLYKGYV